MFDFENNKWTVEVNLNDDARLPAAYHVDELLNTLRNNIERVYYKREVENWVVVAITDSLEFAQDIASHMQQTMVEMYPDEPKSEKMERHLED